MMCITCLTIYAIVLQKVISVGYFWHHFQRTHIMEYYISNIENLAYLRQIGTKQKCLRLVKSGLGY